MPDTEFADCQQELEQTQLRLAELQAKFDAQTLQLNEMRATLGEFTREAEPSELDSSIFPRGLVVKSFLKGDHLKLQMTGVSLVGRAIVAVFGLVWTSAMFSALLSTKVPVYIVAIIGLTFYWFAFLRTPIINFDFKKRKIIIAGFGSVVWKEFQPLVIDTVQGKNGWASTLKLGMRHVARFPEEQTSEAATNNVAEFVRALNWEMGISTLTVQASGQVARLRRLKF